MNNMVSLSGQISRLEFSHTVYDENFYSAILSVKRTSNVIDAVPLIVSDKLFDIDRNYTNETVQIAGQVRTYTKEIDNKKILLLKVFATDFKVSNNEDINEVYLDGYICKTPIYRETPLGRQITDFILAVNRPFNKSDYIPCIAWGRNAIFISRVDVGEHIQLFGRFQSREYSKGNDTKTAYEISVSNLEIM